MIRRSKKKIMDSFFVSNVIMVLTPKGNTIIVIGIIIGTIKNFLKSVFVALTILLNSMVFRENMERL